jgi:uncharacterized protein YndB with AHSA1/START domain
VSLEAGWTVELEHRVGASPEKVFPYFTDPDKYRKWKGVDAELDARPGGVYRVTMGPDVWVRGEYLAVEPPHRLLLSWGFESARTLPRGLAQVPAGSSTVEFTFVPDGDGTIIRVRHTGLPSEEAHWAHGTGWNTYLPRLAAVVTGEDPGDDPGAELTATLFRGMPAGKHTL